MKFIIYVAVLLFTAAGLAVALDQLSKPPKKIEANARGLAGEGVRKIPIKPATARENGDPNNQLTLIYPAAPGQDLPVKDTPVKAAATSAPKPAETDGSASAAPNTFRTGSNAAAAAPSPGAFTPSATAANQCNVQACAAAYRSFRESDCSYQPYDGPRKFCDVSSDQQGQAAATPSTSPPSSAQDEPQQRARATTSRDDELDDVVRAVRRLPGPDYADDDDGMVMVEPRYSRDYDRDYRRQRRWVIERQ